MAKRRQRAVRQLISLLVAVLVQAGIGLPAFAQEVHRFDIDAANATQAVQTFAHQAGVQLLASADALEGKRLGVVRGKLSTDEGLARLLSNTGLGYRYVGERAVAIVDGRNGGSMAAALVAGSSAAAGRTFDNDASNIGDAAKSAQSEAAARKSPSQSANETAQLSSRGRTQQTSLEEIVVTAQKRQERLLDVPQSVTVLSADDLSRLGATQFRDLANTVPGLTFTTGGAGFNQISLRGVTTGLDISSTVGVYVDEVPYGSSSAFARGARFTHDGGLFDIERIEVLRGPQGTLYGTSTMGGLVKYVSKRPNAQALAAELQTGVSGTENGDVNYDVAAAVNVPMIVDKLALRASAFETRDGGYVDNVELGQKDVNRADIYGGRLDVLYTPTDAFSIRVVGLLHNVSRDGTGTVDYIPGLTGTPLDGELTQRRPIAEPYEQRFRLASATVDYDFDAARLTAISSYQSIETDVIYDLSPVLIPAFAASGPFGGVAQRERPATDKFTQELRLASDGAQPLEWVVGGFYTYEDSERTLEYLLITPTGQPAANTILNLSGPSTYEEYAAFGDLTLRLTSKFDVTGGLRYARNRQAYTQTATGARARSAPTTRETDEVVTYLANARYHFSSDSTAYVRYATGYRPGGPNFIVIDPATGLPTPGEPRFEPDELESYEIGYKTEMVDDHLTVDIAAYYIDWSDLQVFDLTSPFGGITNASAATVRGIELAFAARSASNFNLTGAFAYQDAEMSEAEVSLGAVEEDQLVNVPRYTASLNGDYAFPGLNHGATVGATVRYVSDRNTAYTNSPASRQHRLPDYVSVDLRAGLTLGRVETQLYVRNLFDERGELSALVFAGRPQIAIMQPRTVGIMATVRF